MNGKVDDYFYAFVLVIIAGVIGLICFLGQFTSTDRVMLYALACGIFLCAIYLIEKD